MTKRTIQINDSGTDLVESLANNFDELYASKDGLGDSSTRNVGVLSGDVMAADDARVVSVPHESLATTEIFTGEEIIAAKGSSGGIGVRSKQLISPVHMKYGLAKNRFRDIVDFRHIRTGYAFTNGGPCDLAPFTGYFGGAGAGITQLGFFLGYPILQLKTGTASNGYASLHHTLVPTRFDLTQNYKVSFRIAIGSTLTNAAGQTYLIQAGLTVGPASAVPTKGIYIEGNASSANLIGVTKNSVGNTPSAAIGTQVADGPLTCTVFYNAAQARTEFSIDGGTPQYVTNAQRLIEPQTPGAPSYDFSSDLLMTITIRKLSGNTEATMLVAILDYDLQSDDLIDSLGGIT